MAGKHLEFIWDMGNGKKLTIPVQITPVSTSGKGIQEGKLINPENKEFLSQVYIDKTTGKTFDYKDRTHRRFIDKNRGIDIVYTKDERDTFMEISVDSILKVEKEYDLIYLPEVMDFKGDSLPQELFSLDESERKGMKNLLFAYQLLQLRKKFLLVKYGYNGEYRAGIIIANSKQLLLIELTDGQQLKGINQLGIPVNKDETIEEIRNFVKEFSKKNIIELWEKFKEAKVKGTKIEVIEKPKIVVQDNDDWQDKMLQDEQVKQGKTNSKPKEKKQSKKKAI